MGDALTFTQKILNPESADVEMLTFQLKNGKLRIVMESESRATVSGFTLLDGEFSALIEWLIENAAVEGETGEEAD